MKRFFLKIIWAITLATSLMVLAAPSQAQAAGCSTYLDKSLSNNNVSLPPLPQYCSIGQLVLKVMNIAFVLVASTAVIFIIIGGYYYMTARGNETQSKKGRSTVLYAVVGLIVVILAATIVNLLVNFLLSS